MQMLPIMIPRIFFEQLQTKLYKFIWEKKSPRRRCNILFHAKTKGGLAEPDIYRYYAAIYSFYSFIHLARIIEGCSQSQFMQWVEDEQSFVKIHLRGLPWIAPHG